MDRSFSVGGRRIEAAWYGPPPDRAPTLVLLHEGLGCLAMWRDFPRELSQHTGYGVLAYSRPGYGKSDPLPLPWPVTYMHDDARDVLPQILDQAEIRDAILVGHGDGAAIATIYAGSHQDFRVHGLALMAPHFFVEDITIRSVAATRQAFETGDLRQRLAKYHGDNIDVAFRGWNGVWLDPAFRSWRIDEYVAYLRVPMLIIQGRDDQHHTSAQVAVAQREAYCPVEVVMLDQCGRSPHVDRPKATLEAIAAFVHRVLAHEGLAPAA